MDIYTYSDSDLGFSYNKPTATTVGTAEEDIVYINPSGYLTSDYIRFDTPCSRLELYVSLQRLKRIYYPDTETYDEETTDIGGTCTIRWYYLSGGSYFYLGSTNYGLSATNKTAEKAVSDVPIMANATHFRVCINCDSVLDSSGEIPLPPTPGTWRYLQEAIATVKTEYWYTSADNPDEVTSDMDVPQPPSIMISSMPLAEWRVEGGKVTNALLPDYVPSGEGAFKYASHLTDISIPRSVKFIGEEAFRYTALTRVRIAEDCVFFPTSFPEGCAVELNDTVEYGQLVDCDGVEILDREAVRLYVKGEVE